MKCPECGNELKESGTFPSYGLCDNCMKRFDWEKEAGRPLVGRDDPKIANYEYVPRSTETLIRQDVRIIKYIAMFFCALAIVSMICMFVMSYQVSKITASYQKTYEKLFETTGTDSYGY